MNLKCLFILIIFVISSNAVLTSSSISLSNNTNSSTKTQNLSQTMPTIHFSTGTQTTDTLANMVADFNANFSASYGFKVVLDQNAFLTTSQHDTYVADFQAHSTALDVISMDVIWPAEFANAGYILPLDNVFNASYQSQFISAQIQAGVFNGHIYSVPWFHDSAMLYYRSDVLNYANNQGIINDPNGAAPTTWDELTNWTLDMMGNQQLVSTYNLTSGFVWQGKVYEGLMCDFMEYLGATGTYSFLNAGQTQATFNTSSGLASALAYMRSLITSGVSPQAVLTYDEEGSRAVWNAGEAIFMRNWPYAYPLSLNSQNLNGSLVSGAQHNQQQFNVAVMPAANSSVLDPRTSCLGGWQLGVSAYSKYPEQSKQFIMWLTAAQQQTTYFLGVGETPTLKGLYNSPAIVNSPQGYVSKFLPIFESSIPRPVYPFYLQMSAVISPVINYYLGGSITLQNALNKLQSNAQNVINRNPITGPRLMTTTTTSATPSSSLSTTISLAPGFDLFSTLALLIAMGIIFKKRTLKKK